LNGAVMQNWVWNSTDNRCSNRFSQDLPYGVLHQIPNSWNWGSIEEFYDGNNAPQPKLMDSSSPYATAQQSNVGILHRDRGSATLG
jgi:hypothetical protein